MLWLCKCLVCGLNLTLVDLCECICGIKCAMYMHSVVYEMAYEDVCAAVKTLLERVF